MTFPPSSSSKCIRCSPFVFTYIFTSRSLCISPSTPRFVITWKCNFFFSFQFITSKTYSRFVNSSQNLLYTSFPSCLVTPGVRCFCHKRYLFFPSREYFFYPIHEQL